MDRNEVNPGEGGMVNPLSSFFGALASRMYKENALSDITYALLEADESFRKFSLDFFFKEEQLRGKDVSVAREYVIGDSRPDFWIRSEKEVYLVEFKIYNGRHHFEQYRKILETEGSKKRPWNRLGYIANYSLKDVEVCDNGEKRKASELGCRLREWKDFQQELGKCNESGNPLIFAYLAYLKCVCPFDDFDARQWSVNLKDFIFVKEFYGRLTDAIRKAGCEVYESSRPAFDQNRLGRFFSFANEGKQTVWGWVGVLYRNKSVVLCVEFENRTSWGRLICEKYRECITPNGCLQFYYQDGNPLDVAVEEFFKRVISNEIPPNKSGAVVRTERKNGDEIRLLSVKALHARLESLSNKIDILGYNLVFDDKRGQTKPAEFCGRFFKLVPKDVPSEDVLRLEAGTLQGWMGVLYSDGCKYVDESVPNKEGEAVVGTDGVKFMVELWGIPLETTQAGDWHRNSWEALCWTSQEFPSDGSLLSDALAGVLQSRSS